jgi:hypothetical protein
MYKNIFHQKKFRLSGKKALMTKHYYSYLLRLWHSADLESPTWRASLEDPATRQVTSFNSLEGLSEFLMKLLTSPESDRTLSPQSKSSPVNLATKRKPNS